tara:strand:- start:459 stop:692 length:234 start_codon:yes stop_codon:yes gene_type:complete
MKTTQNKINTALTIHEDNKGIFYRLHLERSKDNQAPHNSGGFSEAHDVKPSIELIQALADAFNHNAPCTLVHQFETV